MTTTFESARKGLDEVRAAEWEYQLVDLLAAHDEGERDLLEAYERLAASAQAPAVTYLIRQIVEDERRHHRVMAEMANSIAWNWSRDKPESAVPGLPSRAVGEELVAATRKLLDAERRDHSELKKLRKELKPFADTTLWALLVDVMLLETDKHIRVLRFLIDHLAS
jgi:rubrerythrin